MDIKEFSALIQVKRKEIDNLMKRKMPVYAGRLAKEHFQDNFRKEGFVNNGLQSWDPAKRKSTGGKSAAARYGTLLSSRNHLFKSIKYIPSDYRVKVANELQYAPIHNWGGTVSQKITPQMRKFAWAMYYKEMGKKKKGKPRSEVPENPVAEKWKGLALTKKKKLNIKIPQRQFLGESRELSDKINEKMETELRTILNS